MQYKPDEDNQQLSMETMAVLDKGFRSLGLKDNQIKTIYNSINMYMRSGFSEEESLQMLGTGKVVLERNNQGGVQKANIDLTSFNQGLDVYNGQEISDFVKTTQRQGSIRYKGQDYEIPEDKDNSWVKPVAAGVAAAAILAPAVSALGDTYSIDYEQEMVLDGDSPNQQIAVNDSFTLELDPNSIDGYSITEEILKAPVPFDGQVKLTTIVDGYQLQKDSRDLDTLPKIFEKKVIVDDPPLFPGAKGNVTITWSAYSLPNGKVAYMIDRGTDPQSFVERVEMDTAGGNHQFYINGTGLRRHIDTIIEDEFDAKDLYKDGMIDFLDFSKLAANWMETGKGLVGDINRDNSVDMIDLSILIEDWLETKS